MVRGRITSLRAYTYVGPEQFQHGLNRHSDYVSPSQKWGVHSTDLVLLDMIFEAGC